MTCLPSDEITFCTLLLIYKLKVGRLILPLSMFDEIVDVALPRLELVLLLCADVRVPPLRCETLLRLMPVLCLLDTFWL